MKLNSACFACMINGCAAAIADRTDEDNKSLYMRDVLQAILDEPEDTSSPCLGPALKKAYEKHFGPKPEVDYTEINRSFNKLVMDQLPEIEKAVRATEDPILSCIKYALAANYIDYTAVDVTNEGLLEMLANSAKAPLDLTEYPKLLEDLAKAKKMVFLHDNCGEIVVDKLLIKLLREKFPNLEVKACVRGGPAANDAVMADAEYIGLSEVAEVIDNGCAITGTPLKWVSESTLNDLKEADVIISKGQGNFETTFDCGLNIYYLFLCKCALFTHLFDMERFSCTFVNNLRLEELKASHGIMGEAEVTIR